ncbi:hypothetical protein Hanom_Chr12g01166991 [Helianthus anomalus]
MTIRTYFTKHYRCVSGALTSFIATIAVPQKKNGEISNVHPQIRSLNDAVSGDSIPLYSRFRMILVENWCLIWKP